MLCIASALKCIGIRWAPQNADKMVNRIFEQVPAKSNGRKAKILYFLLGTGLGICLLFLIEAALFHNFRQKEKMVWKALDEEKIVLEDLRYFSSWDYIRIVYDYSELYNEHRKTGRLEYSIWTKDGLASYITNGDHVIY